MARDKDDSSSDREGIDSLHANRIDKYLQHMQRLEALSKLTGGLIHDLNNKLMIINANIDMAAKQVKDRPQAARKLLAALVAAEQAGSMISKMLTLFNKPMPQMQYMDVGDQLSSVADMLQRTLVSKGVDLEVSISGTLPPVKADPDEFQTAIVNLVVNASDAMEGGGTVFIDASPCLLRTDSLPGLSLKGQFVRISVEDTGHGIPQDHMQHIFEPFFTTRERDHWRGLGLPQVHSFALEAGGAVHIDSAVGEGTTVSLYLPKSALDAHMGKPRLIDETGEFEDEFDEGTVRPELSEILVVDDEVEVALAVQSMVEKFGYRSRIAIGAEEALFTLSEKQPSLVLSDISMRGIDGVALARAIQTEWPDLPVVLISGNPSMLVADIEFPVLAKPITSRDLSVALRRNLTEPKPSNVVSLPIKGRKP